jgi:hypothetical protein
VGAACWRLHGLLARVGLADREGRRVRDSVLVAAEAPGLNSRGQRQWQQQALT